MPALLQLQDDTGTPISVSNLGAIADNSASQAKLNLVNIGLDPASSVLVSTARVSSNDGLDFSSIALDNNGNPGTFGTAALSLGTIASGESIPFWYRVSVPTGATPIGNPRQFSVNVRYVGT